VAKPNGNRKETNEIMLNSSDDNANVFLDDLSISLNNDNQEDLNQ